MFQFTYIPSLNGGRLYLVGKNFNNLKTQKSRLNLQIAKTSKRDCPLYLGCTAHRDPLPTNKQLGSLPQETGERSPMQFRCFVSKSSSSVFLAF